MINRVGVLMFSLTLLSSSTLVLSDDLTGSTRILCTPVLATQCFDDGECVTAPPWSLNIPQFIEVDLDGKRLSTTKASGENRSTPIKNLERDGGQIYLQGVENGRAYSLVITEETGMVSIAVGSEGLAVAAFGACTPMSPAK